jgi:hypothetical protein
MKISSVSDFEKHQVMFEWNGNLLLTFSWLSLSAAVLLPGMWLFIDGQLNHSFLNRILQYLCLHGRLTNRSGISKSYFLHFYIVGLLINLVLFVLHLPSFLLFLLFLLHISRRLYECLHVHDYASETKVGYLYYFLRLVHYPCVGVTIIVDYKYSYAHLTLSRYFLALILFFNASYIQYNVHSTLAKRTRSKQDAAPLSNGHWLFNYFSSPNYLAEALIYVAFYIASCRTSAMASLLVWVFVNQSLSALLNHRWYCQHYLNVYSTKRYALIPFLL